ncbi:SPOR domain-containing protein [Sneathiella sp.]|uniref:SPOR domain-containing protein n=1 Tax=Sneathiella sp. TaxID=1964365 RepID=UPI002FE1531D
MPHHNLLAARLRIALLATTGLVVAGCNTTSTTTASAYPTSAESAPVASRAADAPDTKGLNYKSLMRVADRARDRNDAPTALRLYAGAAEQEPRAAAPLLAMGDILRETGKLDQAAAAYNEALMRDRSSINALQGLGYIYLQLEKPYQASQHFTRALEINAEDAKSLGGLAVALDKAGDHTKAQDYYRKAIQADPENLNYKSNLALSLALSGNTDQGIAILKTVTEMPEATAKHRQTLALIYGLAGKSGEALKYSRMDLSEEETRNNALYFAALNGKTDEDVRTLDQQMRAMKASYQQPVVAEKLDAPRLPENPDRLVARMDTDHLSTDASRTKPTDAPKKLIPAPLAPVMVAKADSAQATPVQDIAPVVTAEKSAPKSADEMIVAHAEVVKQQAKATATANATASSTPSAPSPAVAGAAEKPAPSREWTIASKPAAPAAPKAAVAAETSAATPTVMKAAFTKEVTAYLPDGGNYFLQIGSYKDKPLAEKGWQIVQSQNTDLLGDIEPVYSYADLGEDNGGVHYRLQIGGFSDKARMLDLCAALQARSFDCFMPAPKKAGPAPQQAPALAPGQRMVDSDAPSPKTPANGMVADTEDVPGVF